MAKKKATGRKSARKQSTALVRASKQSPAKKRPARPKPALPAAATVPAEFAGPLTEDASMGALGLVEIALTAKEEAVLAEPVNEEHVRLLPSGLVYYPHAAYRKWLNRAFGRLGWSLRPITKPLRNENTVGVYYILFVHGKPVAQAFGAQEYHDNNRQMSWDDAIEATEASALRRIMKRLGVSLELWDRQFNARFVAAHGVKVKCKEWKRGGGTQEKERWRLKTDPPLPGEFAVIDAKQEKRQTARRTAAAEQGSKVQRPDERIDDVMLDRLMTAITNSGRNVEDVKKALDVTKLGNLTRGAYEKAVAMIESDGKLPLS